MTSLREQYEEKKKTDQHFAGLIKARIKYVLDYLEKLKLQEMRQKYFQEADRLRALGLNTEHLSNRTATNPRKHKLVVDALVTLHIGLLLQQNIDPRVTIAKVMAYLLRKPEKEILNDDHETEPHLETSLDLKSSDGTRCLLCDFPYSNVSSLTRHVRKFHTFTKSFNCPECIRNGNAHEIDGIPSAWSNHVKQFHGKNHTPNLSSQPEKPAYCPICQKSFTVNGFSSHYNRHQRTLKFPFNCDECLRQEKSDVTSITSLDDWILHVRHTHNGGQIHGAILKTDINKKRSLEHEDTSSKRVKVF